MSSQLETVSVPKGDLIGAEVPRMDSQPKVSGKIVYTRDMKLKGMLFARVKRCPIPHARIKSIDISQASKLPGVIAIITGDDFPAMNNEDTPALAQGEVLYANQAVAAVAAESRLLAANAVDKISVSYEELPAVLEPEAAVSEHPPCIITHPGEKQESPNVGRHIRIRKGDVDAAMRTADSIFENDYRTRLETHQQMEPLTFLAQPEADGGVTIWGTAPGAHILKARVAKYLGIDFNLVRAKVPFLGGWFGGKEETPIAAVCALLAMRSGLPVKLELSREETMTATGARHPAVIRVKDGVMKDGRIVAREIRALYAGGAYSAMGNGLLRNAILGAISVYNIPNIKVDAYRVYTNHIPGTPKRSPIGLQMSFAIECHVERIASALGLDPVHLRMKNILHPGDENAIGETMQDISHDKSLLAVKEAIKLDEATRERTVAVPGAGPWRRGKGIAIAAKWGPGGFHEGMVRVKPNGDVEVWCDLIENGQGAFTVFRQIAASEFGIAQEKVTIMSSVRSAESESMGFSPGASASRQTVNIGKAIHLASEDAKRKIAEEAAKHLGIQAKDVEIRNGRVFDRTKGKSLAFAEILPRAEGGDVYYQAFVGHGSVNKRLGYFDPSAETAVGGRISPYYITVAQAADVEVNIETGQVRVVRVAASMDVGKALNPLLVRHQIFGSVAMGISAALSEELVLADGRIANGNMADYKIITAPDAPDVVPIIMETPYDGGPFGAKGAGEAAMLPSAAAVRNAIHAATGAWIDELPLTPERVLEAIDEIE